MDDEERQIIMYRLADGPFRKAGNDIGEVTGVLIDATKLNVRLRFMDGRQRWVKWDDTSLVPEEDIIARFL